MASQPSGESVQTGVYDTLSYIPMIEHIPNLPTALFFYLMLARLVCYIMIL